MALPSGYTKLDYIESSGTQYINTGFKPNQNTRCVIDIENLSSAQAAFFGARANQNAASFTYFSLTATTGRSDYGSSKQSMSFTNTVGRYTVDQNKNVCTANGVTATGTANTFQLTNNLYLMAVNQADAAIQNAKMKLYSAKVYDNGTLVRDFIPCKNANDTLGLWDNVNSVFYANAGKGTFGTGTKHKTLIDGTGYEIKSGRVLIAGTGYDIKKGRTLIGGTGYDIKFATPIGELPAGTIVYMNVDGVRKEFIVTHQGNPISTIYGESCSGTWVVLKDIDALTIWSVRSSTAYSSDDCAVRNLALAFASRLDSEIQSNLIPVAIAADEYENIDGDKVFAMATYDFDNLSYFKSAGNSKRIATYNGAATSYYLRNNPSGYGNYVAWVTTSGSITSSNEGVLEKRGFRPEFILSSAPLLADSDFNIIPA